MAAACRVILIGASNLTLGFPLLMRSLPLSYDGNWEVFAAHGHGRSFCQKSYVLNRGLPAITQCGIWSALQQQPPVDQSWAMLTDLGNDLIYGVPLDTLLDRVQQTLQLLRQYAGAITFVRPPLERIRQLTARQYRLFKQLLFPGPTLPWSELWPRVVELDEQATLAARQVEATIVVPELSWYGLDPIHIRRTVRLHAWEQILRTWNFPFAPHLQLPSYRQSATTWSLAPAERSYGRRTYITPQPHLRPPQLSLWLY